MPLSVAFVGHGESPFYRLPVGEWQIRVSPLKAVDWSRWPKGTRLCAEWIHLYIPLNQGGEALGPAGPKKLPLPRSQRGSRNENS